MNSVMTIKHWSWLAAGILLCVLVYLLKPILMPFVIASALAYLGDPIVDWLQRRRLSRTAGVVVVFTVLTLANLLGLLLIVPMLEDQISTFVQRVPGYLQWLADSLRPWLGGMIPDADDLDIDSIKEALKEHWGEVDGVRAAVMEVISQRGAALLLLLGNLMLVPVVAFYLLRDWDDLVAHVGDLVPRDWLPKVTELARESDEVLSAFIRGQLFVMLGLGITYSLGLWLVGLDLALLIGMAAGMVSFVPYLGVIVGMLSAGTAIIVQTQELLPLLWVGLVFGIGQILESSVFTPLLVGDRIGLHPVAVIFAVLAGGQLFGFFGVLMALPVAAVLAVMLRHLRKSWLQSQSYLGNS